MEELMKELNSIKKYIPYNTYRTIKGQMKSGNMAAARTGINRIKKSSMVEGHKNIIQVWNGCFGQIWCNYVNW